MKNITKFGAKSTFDFKALAFADASSFKDARETLTDEIGVDVLGCGKFKSKDMAVANGYVLSAKVKDVDDISEVISVTFAKFANVILGQSKVSVDEIDDKADAVFKWLNSAGLDAVDKKNGVDFTSAVFYNKDDEVGFSVEVKQASGVKKFFNDLAIADELIELAELFA